MPANNPSSQLLDQAADCGLRITGLDGWTQTRLAGALSIRRETLNAIINRSPGSEPTPQRPRMVEACRRLIMFAAALSAKEDAVLKLPVNVANLQSDDGQAYEHHRLRLHQLVESAAADESYTDALCRIGEFASAAMYAAPAYRLRMICNLVTAIQRLLDKPGSRLVPQALLKANLSRVYRAERLARHLGRLGKADENVREQATYIRGQAGYALIFTGILLPNASLIRRGGARLFRGVEAQPDASYGHWSNLLRAIDDLLAVDRDLGQRWSEQAQALAARQGGRACSEACDALQAKGEIPRLLTAWGQTPKAQRPANPIRRRASKLAALGLGLILAAIGASSARAGDGRDFKSAQAQPTPTPPPAVAQRARRGFVPPPMTAEQNAPPLPRMRGIRSILSSTRSIPADADIPPMAMPRVSMPVRINEVSPDMWGESIAAMVRSVPSEPIVAPLPSHASPPAIHRPLAASHEHEVVSAQAMTQLVSDVAPRPAPKPLSSAEKADAALTMARNYLTAERFDIAREKLQQVLGAYPETPAAAQAQQLLQQVSTR